MSLRKNYADLEKTEETIPSETVEIQKSECRLYRRRWLMLTIFVIYSMSNSMQWIQYSIISNVVSKYYRVDYSLIDWTSMISEVTYIPLVFPASWLLDKLGIRIAVILGAVGTCVGSWIKVFSIPRDTFSITFVGQTVVAISQIFILSLPARLAAIWFGQNEVSSACSIGVLGNQVGIAVGFIIPPLLVQNDENEDIVANGLRLMYYSVAILTTVILIIIIVFFEDTPDLPPSLAQVAQKNSDSSNYFASSLRRLMTNKGYVLLLISYGINVGVFYAISTLLNQMILHYFPNGEREAGVVGLLLVLIGMLGSVACGYVLDKTRLFKETTLIVYLCSVLGMLAYTLILDYKNIYVVYITASILGFFMTGYLPVGFELACELTYPEPEGTSVGLLNAAAQVFGISLTMAYSWLISSTNEFWANICLTITLSIGTLLTAFIPSDLRRQSAGQVQ